MKNIVNTASEARGFKNLVTAIKAAGLVEALSGKGPFTVFAPNDAAFEKLPRNTLSDILKDKKKLTSILKYHVVPGKLGSKDVMKLDSAKTLHGGKIYIDTSKGVKVNNSNIIKADIGASNGLIHVIDRVMLPD